MPRARTTGNIRSPLSRTIVESTRPILTSVARREPGAGSRELYTYSVESSDPTILWRLTRGKSTAHATVFPGDGRHTVTWYIDGQMDRAENYDTLELALARAEHIHGILLRDGWKDAV